MKKNIGEFEFESFDAGGVNCTKLLFYSISGIDKIGGFEKEYYYLSQFQYFDGELVGQDLFVTPSYKEAEIKFVHFLKLRVEIDTEISSLFKNYKH